MNAMHRQLIEHEAGHAIVGLLAGLRVHRVHAPPPPDVPPSDLDRPAGVTEFKRSGDRRALAVALLGGPLAEGKPAPAWPVEPTRYSHDERMLARLVNETDPLCYAELVADAREIVDSDEFVRMHQVGGELLAHPPHELSGEQLKGIRQAIGHQAFPTRIRVKSKDEVPATDCERDELGVISDAEVERCIRQLRADQPVLEVAPSTNGSNGTGAKGLEAVEAEAYEWMRKVLSDVTIRSYVGTA